MPVAQQRITVGVGAGAAGVSAQDVVLTLGAQHPATHGVLLLRLTLEEDRITGCEPLVGYLHRGVEKLFEVRDYRQIIVLANRHDWLSAFASELGVSRIVLTHADETGHVGPAVGLAIRSGRPFSYISSGTSVDGGLLPVNPHALASIIVT